MEIKIYLQTIILLIYLIENVRVLCFFISIRLYRFKVASFLNLRNIYKKIKFICPEFASISNSKKMHVF